MQAQFRPKPPDEDTAEKAVLMDGKFTFKTLRLVAAYGVTYHLHFSVLPREKWGGIVNATSKGIRANPCGESEFYIAGNTSCEVCLRSWTGYVWGASCHNEECVSFSPKTHLQDNPQIPPTAGGQWPICCS